MLLRLFVILFFVGTNWHVNAMESGHLTDAERLILPVEYGAFPVPEKERPVLPETGWQRVPVPDVGMVRTDKPQEGYIQTIWYRFTLHEEIVNRRAEMYLYLPRWQTVGQLAIYGDDRLLWHSSGDKVWNGFNQPIWISLDFSGRQRPAQIFLRMDSVPGLGAGISSAWVGNEEQIRWRYSIRMFLQVHLLQFTSLAFLALGLFSFSIWWRRRHEVLYLLSFIASFCFAGRYWNYIAPLDTTLISSAWFGWVSMNAVSWLTITILIFNFKLCGRRYRWLECLMLAGVFLQGILSLPLFASSEGIVALAGLTYWGILLMAIPACLLALYASWQVRSMSGLVLALISLLSFPLGMHDIQMHNYQRSMENIYLLPLSEISFFIVFAFIIRHRYLQGVESLERSHEMLALRLQEREDELKESYARVRTIEQRALLNSERQRLMRDMHDGLGGALTHILVRMNRDDCPADALKIAVQECIDELRMTIDSLELAESDLSLLLAGRRFRFQSQLEAAGIRLLWRVEALPFLPWLTPTDAMHVMRIVQEILTNIIKHANASEVGFSTYKDASRVCICIEDNGVGFANEDSAMTVGRGLRNICYRADILGALVTWESTATLGARSGGTRFILALPLEVAESMARMAD